MLVARWPARRLTVAILIAAGTILASRSDVRASSDDSSWDHAIDETVAVSVDDLPRDMWGEVLIERMPGLRPQREVSADARQAQRSLWDLRDLILVTAPHGDWVVDVPPLAGDNDGPLPIDADHPDPERIRRDSLPADVRLAE
jgi:hypothetical protein